MMDLLMCIQVFFEGAWGFITGVTIPGTDFTVAQLMFALAFFGIGLRILGAMIGVRFPSIPNTNDSASRILGRSYGAAGSNRVKISKERRGDDR